MEHDRLKNLHLLVLFALATAGVLFSVLSSPAIWTCLPVALLWLSVFVMANLVVYPVEKYRKFSLLALGLQFLLLLLLCYSTTALGVKLLLCVMIANCFIVFRGQAGVATAAAAMLLYVAAFALQQRPDLRAVLLFVFEQSPLFLLTGILSYLIGKVLKSNAIIERAMVAAQMRQVDLNNAYQELNTAYQNLEEMAALRERNRIAREIHDTVGHTITTTIVEMEAGRMLLEKDRPQAQEKLRMAHDQARRALEELRASVRLLSTAGGTRDLRAEVLEAAADTMAHAGVLVRCDIAVPEAIGHATAALVLRIFKEGLSNGIRHGGSTAFFLKLHSEDTRLKFLLQDNGSGCGAIVPGFGLANMRASVQAAGGTAAFASEVGEGFEIDITLPWNREESDGTDPRAAG